MRRGPRHTIDAREFAAFLDLRSEHQPGGRPQRTHTFINGIAVTPSDQRQIRRWRNGQVQRVTSRAATALLLRYNIINTRGEFTHE